MNGPSANTLYKLPSKRIVIPNDFYAYLHEGHYDFLQVIFEKYTTKTIKHGIEVYGLSLEHEQELERLFRLKCLEHKLNEKYLCISSSF